jgi:uncharacterized membrane protein SpoIIM required for sporulation
MKFDEGCGMSKQEIKEKFRKLNIMVNNRILLLNWFGLTIIAIIFAFSILYFLGVEK